MLQVMLDPYVTAGAGAIWRVMAGIQSRQGICSYMVLYIWRSGSIYAHRPRPRRHSSSAGGGSAAQRMVGGEQAEKQVKGRRMASSSMPSRSRQKETIYAMQAVQAVSSAYICI